MKGENLKRRFEEYDSVLDLLEALDREGITGLQRQEAYKRFMNLRARMLGRAYSGGFELTPLCNFDCRMCYVHLSKEQLAREANVLSTGQWIDIMGQAVDAGMMHADLTGGECLSYPGFRDVYLYLRSRGVEVSILTNGQLITEEMADFLAQYPPSVVQMTIYGSNEEAYEAVTGRRAFADVCAAIDRLKRRGIRVFLPITPNRFMQKDPHALLAFLRGQGLRYAIGTGSLPARPETGRELEAYAPEAAMYVTLHQDEQAYQRSLGQAAIQYQGAWVDRVPRGFKPLSGPPCSSGQSAFHINWRGEMQPCIPFHTITRSVLAYGFDDCWAWIKAQMAAYEPPKECRSCPNKAVCVACPAERTLGELNGPLNKMVCERYACYVQAGILRPPQEPECR